MPRGVSRYDEAALQQRLWTPYLLPSGVVVGWLDFSDLATITCDGSGNISQINTKYGTTNAVQATSTKRPAFAPTTWDGKGCMYHNSTGKYFSANYVCNNAYFACTATSSTMTIVGGSNGTGPDFYYNASKLVLDLAGVVNYVNVSAASSGRHVIGYEHLAGSTSVFQDGATIGTGGGASVSTGTNVLFINRDLASFSYSLPMGEAIFLNNTTTNQKRLVEGYLAWKWGTVGNLVASHPFKNRPPLIGG